MSQTANPTVIADDVVVSLEYTLTVDGEIVDSTEGIDPIEFIQGHENIIAGLERELYGLKIGDTKKVTVNAADAYGEIDPEAVVDVPRDEIPSDIPLKVGVELDVKNEDGDVLEARIIEITKDNVRLDFNHVLAGKELTFEVTVVDLRAADEEELEHGHVHSEDGDDDEDFEYFDEDDFDDEDEDEEEEDDDDDSSSNGSKK
ncbi:MAG: peptidylprolyl isomerase [Anaerolineaceae bacterium]|nr:peptidylprolyl isomerase [Anaerolineaceae bacterium]